MLKLALISPKGPLYRHRKGIFRKSLRYQPLTLTTLAALVPADVPSTLQLIDEGVDDVPEDLDVDLVGITVITGTANRAYELAGRLRERGITVVLGGPHVTLIPEDAQPHAFEASRGRVEPESPGESGHDAPVGSRVGRCGGAARLMLDATFEVGHLRESLTPGSRIGSG